MAISTRPMAAAPSFLRDGKPNGPYPSSVVPSTELFVLSSSGRTAAELLCLDTLAGLLARTSPRLYRVNDADWESDASDSYASWLRAMQAQGITVNNSMLNATVPGVVAAFAGTQRPLKYVLAAGATRCVSAPDQEWRSWRLAPDRRCGTAGRGEWSWKNADSISAALTLAAASNDLLVVADESLAAGLEGVGVKLFTDVRTSGVEDVLKLPGVMDSLSDTIYIFQDPSKATFLGDYATFARAASLPFGAEHSAQKLLLGTRKRQALGAAFGWGPENTYVSTCNAAGVYVHASDFCTNLAALSNTADQQLPVPPPSRDETGSEAALASLAELSKQAPPTILPPVVSEPLPRHTVAFVMTDGDNLQWALGPWTTDERWWGSSQRGKVPVGWTLSPALGRVAPAALRHIKNSQTSSDELVAGPSGIGYAFPQTWPSDSRAQFATLTAEEMKPAGMSLVNVLGQNDDPPGGTLLAALFNHSEIEGALYYPFGGGYSALEGRMWRVGSTLALSGRVSLWGNDTSGTMLGVTALVDRLLAMPRAPTSADGYSIVPVHAWSHSYADIVSVAQALQDSGHVDVVLPSELLRRVNEQVWRVGCECDTPSAGTAGHNRYTCSDGTVGYCAADERCFTALSFAKGDWQSGCGKASA